MTTTKPPAPQEVLKRQLAQMGPALAAALPGNVPLEKFKNVVLTVANQNPNLLKLERKSLLGACMRCAADGLVPDGREATIVEFSGKAQYMPMVVGVLKRARNSGEISSINAHVVYEGDEFAIRLGDEEGITHTPKLDGDRGKPRAVYAIARLKDGSVARAWMTVQEVEKVRNVSRSKGSGPWTQWWDEMAKKTVIRRLSKYLPMDAEGARVMERDDDLGKPQGDADAVQGLVIEGVADTQSDRLDAIEGGLGGDEDALEGEIVPRDDFPGDRPLEAAK
jgi:recombination protein RecT